jgi:TRAP-type mannitol/chloroaromatic compound transport system substrate-binding protein
MGRRRNGPQRSVLLAGQRAGRGLLTAVPFGLLPNEHIAWIDAGGGQALWDELYAPFRVKPFMAGNTGVCMGGWFRHEIKSRDDDRQPESLAGARRRAAGDRDQRVRRGSLLGLPKWSGLISRRWPH